MKEQKFIRGNKKDFSSSHLREGKKASRPICGIHPVIEAIRSGKEIEKIFFQKNAGNRVMGELNEEIKKYNIPFQFVPLEKLNHLVKSTNHQGVVAMLSPIGYQNIETIIPTVFENGETPLVIILDRITDVRNLGAIARSAECAGVHAIIVPSRGSGQINSDAIKSSAGAIFNIPVCRSENLKTSIDFLKKSGLRIIACSEKAEKTIYKTDFLFPVALILGSEEDGISDEYLKLSDDKVQIPLFGKTESLNVSVSAGVILFEVIRQRNFSK
ncbi:MAG: 23S rRNA (guanosine(2251)-2'-O)-methyltransferase RlmB [Bacteroidetes bacterium]|nr:23S rRNA (guanosine(2251)-2'-O)-methyltransferase RlmB [Bacteroidota bacterium]